MTSAVESGFAMLAVAVFLGFIGFAVLLVKEQSSLLSSGTSSIQQQADLNYLFTSAKAHARWHLKQSSCSGYSSLASSIGNDQYGINFSKSDGTPVDVTISANMTNGMKPVQVYSNWTAYDAATTQELQVSDITYIDEDQPSRNFFGDDYANLSGVTGKRQRVLLKMSTAAIPSNATVQKAEMTLTLAVAKGTGLTIQRINEDWTPAEVTWNNRDSGSTWSIAGGSSTGLDYATFDPATGTVTVDITELYREWHAGTDNYGLLLGYAVDQSVSSQILALSGGLPVTTVSVTYACGCGETCVAENTVSCDADIRPNTLRRDIDTAIDPVNGMAYVMGDASVMGVNFPSDGGYVFANQDVLTAVDTGGTTLGTCNPGLAEDISGVSFVVSGANAGNLVVVTESTPVTLAFVGSRCKDVTSQSTTPTITQAAQGITALAYPDGSAYANHYAVTDQLGNVSLINASYQVVSSIAPEQTLSDVYGIAHIPNQDSVLLASQARLEVVNMNLDGTINEFYDTTRFGATALGGLSVNLESCDHILGHDSLTGSEVFQSPLSLTPAAHWKLDDGSGLVAAEAINGFDGNLVGLSGWSDEGAVQGALEFSGFEWVNVPHNDSLNFANEVSISAWVYPDDVTSSQVIISKGFGTVQNFWLGYIGGELTFIYDDGSFQRIDTGAFLSTGQWYHVAATYSTVSGRIAVYLDGTEVASTAATSSLTTNIAPIYLGRSDSGGQVNGRLDDIHLFAGELTAADVGLLEAEGVTGAFIPTPPDAPPSCSIVSFADDFQSGSYSGSTGTETWTNNWTEVGENTNPNGGDIRLRSSGANTYVRLQDNDNGGEGIIRSFDLAHFADATLTFDYARFRLDADESVSITLIQDGTYHQVGLIENPSNAPDDSVASMLSASIDLSSYIGEPADIQFLTSSNMASNHGVYLDNISIEGCSQ